MLITLTKHASFSGYLQGMNNIAGSLLFHSNETIAFDLTIRLLNDYHLKEVHMYKLPGLYYHCEIMDCIIKNELPQLAAHLDTLDMKVLSYAQNWVLGLFT